MRRTIAVLLFTGSLMQAQCRHYFYSATQAKNTRATNEFLHRNDTAERWIVINGKCRKYTEVIEKATQADEIVKAGSWFDDFRFVGTVCGGNQ